MANCDQREDFNHNATRHEMRLSKKLFTRLFIRVLIVALTHFSRLEKK